MKLIIDISEEDYECSKQRWMKGDSVHKLDYCVSKGTPLGDEFQNLTLDHITPSEKDHILRQLRPAGNWIKLYPEHEEWNVYECSCCCEELSLSEGTPADNDYRFCPFCGADMRS